MKKIVLAFCSLADKWLPTLDKENGHYSLGLGMLASVMEEAGYDCRVLFMPEQTQPACLERLRDTLATEPPVVLGFGMMSDNRVATYRAIEMVRLSHPDLPVVIGGVHATVMYQQLLTRYPHLIAVLGEGERTLPELVATLESGQDLSGVTGIAFVRDGTVVTTPNRPLIEDLDALPFAKHALFFTPERTEAQIITSRGCPFRCSFCVLDVLSQRRVRHRKASRVVDEIETILTRFPQVTTFQILDDQFFMLKQHVLDFCAEIQRRGIHKRASFFCSGRVKPLDREMILAMEMANFENVILGLESGSREILKRCHKKITPEDVLRAVSLFADSTINVAILLVIGLPGETRETIMETVELCQQLQRHSYHHYSHKIQTAFVYPGAELHDIAKAAGMIHDDFWLSDQDVPYFTVEHSIQEMLEYRDVLLTHLCAERICTPAGFAAQRPLLHSLIHWGFTQPNLGGFHYQLLVLHVAERMLATGELVIHVDPKLLSEDDPRCGLTRIRRTPGTDHQIEIVAGQPMEPPRFLNALLHYAYTQNIRTLTDRIDRGVEAFLEELSRSPNPLGRLMAIPNLSIVPFIRNTSDDHFWALLKQAIEFHQAGQLTPAEIIYQTILAALPNHPDTNHNYGVLIMQCNQPAASLPFFKTAWLSDPVMEQYCSSYVDALMRDNQPDEAVRVVARARQRGVSDTLVAHLERLLQMEPGGD
ncbi:MAG: B12-binding domain-containing radical SAM protein [Magnetococcales bacterium]|nr:B12-binding domain-containing radical SAM protein [Magnetococcales bacterium]